MAKKIEKVKISEYAITQMVKAGAFDQEKKIWSDERKIAKNPNSEWHKPVAALEPWHYEIVRRIVLYGEDVAKLSKEFGCTKKYAVRIFKSDLGIIARKEILERPDIAAIRKRFKILADYGQQLLGKIIRGEEVDESITLKVRADLALKVNEVAGVPEPFEHKFEFKHKFEKLGSVIEKAGEQAKTIEVKVVNKEVRKIALDSEE